MEEQVNLEPLSQGGAEQAQQPLGLEQLSQIPVELAVELGRTYLTLGEALALDVGSIVTLERTAGEPADLLVNGTPIARGEVVVVEERFGLRITAVFAAGRAGRAPRKAQCKGEQEL